MIESYRSSVNRWECDENDHLNVRFYVEKHMQTVVSGLAQSGYGMSGDDPMGGGQFAQRINNSVTTQHLRFVRESRLSAPLTGSVARLASEDPDVLKVLSELRHSVSGELLCSCVTTMHTNSWQLGELEEVICPDHAGSRGVPDADLAYVALTAEQRSSCGFKRIGMGVVQPGECGGDGRQLVAGVMGRISDSMPHLWGALRGSLEADEGGAVLEYRLRYHQALRLGEVLRVESGLMEVGSKLQRFAHLVLRATDGALMASAEAVGVRMDLVTRRAKTIEQKDRDAMSGYLLRQP